MNEPVMRPERDVAIRRMLVEQVRNEPAAAAKRRRRRVLGWSGVSVLAVGIAATAGAALLAPTPVSDPGIVHCLSAAERDADGSYPGSAATLSSPTGEGRVADAIALCSLMWEQGVLEPGYDPTSADNPTGRVPDDLQVCVMNDGSAAVVPSSNESICPALGLSPLEPDA